MTHTTAPTGRPGIAARFARGLGTFNIAYGILGLLSAALLQFAFPAGMNPLPPSMMIASAVASATAIGQGVLLRVYGPTVTGWIGRALRSLWTLSRTSLNSLLSRRTAA